ncbi:MAG: exonuclease domain-containing protein [Candidatus Thermoplasmatota archaeon]
MVDKPRGYFDKVLAKDCETSGMNYNTVDPSIGFQSISWGLIVADAETFTPIEKLYVEIKWDGKSQWSDEAEKIHGLSRDHLEKNGLTKEEAAAEIGNLIYRHWNPKSDFSYQRNVRCLGHNVATFDIWFMRNLLEPFGIMFPTGNRFIDTSSIAFATFGCFNSDDAFDLIGIKRNKHNALADAQASLDFVKTVRKLCNSFLGE